MQAHSQYLDYLFDPIFKEVNRLFKLSFGNIAQQRSRKRCFLPTI